MDVTSQTSWQRGRWLFHKRLLPIALTYSGLALAPVCFSVSGVMIAVSLLVLTGLGVTVGLHRLLTHRGFSTYRSVKRALAPVLAVLTCGRSGDVTHWASRVCFVCCDRRRPRWNGSARGASADRTRPLAAASSTPDGRPLPEA